MGIHRRASPEVTVADDVELLTCLIRDRVDVFLRTNDPDVLLDATAEAQARALLTAVEDSGGVSPAVVQTLALLHLHRYRLLPPGQDGTDLDTAMRLFQALLPQAAELIPVEVRRFMAPHLADPAELYALGYRAVLDARENGDYDHAVEVLRRVAAADHTIKAAALAAVSVALNERYELTGSQGDLDEAIDTGRAAVDATAHGRAPAPMHLSNLSVALRNRFHRSRSDEDLDEAVGWSEAAVAAAAGDDDEHAMYLAMLGLTLRARGEHRLRADDLDRAVHALERALRLTTTPDSPQAAKRRSNLRSVLRSRYQLKHDPADLKRIVTDARIHVERARASAVPPDEEPLTELADALSTYHSATGDRAALDEAIGICRDLVARDPAPRGGPHGLLRSLLLSRFRWYGDAEDLGQVVKLGEETLAATTADSPGRAAILSAVGSSLREQFILSGDRADLERAASLHREADTQPFLRWTDRLAFRNNLAGAMFALYDLDQRVDLLDEAAELMRRTLRDTPAADPHRAVRYANLNRALRAQWRATGDGELLEEAARLGEEFLHALLPADPTRAGAHLVLAWTAADRSRSTPDADHAARFTASAIRHFRLAVEVATAPAQERLDAAQQWAAVAAAGADWPTALDAQKAVGDLLPMAVWRGLRRVGRERMLSDMAHDVGTDGCAIALHAGEPGRAVEILDQARGITWSQLLDMRSDLTALERAAPEHARRLEHIRMALTTLDLADGAR